MGLAVLSYVSYNLAVITKFEEVRADLRRHVRTYVGEVPLLSTRMIHCCYRGFACLSWGRL